MNRRETETKILMAAALALAFVLTLVSASPAQHGRHYQDDLAYTAPPQVTQKTYAVGATPAITVDNITGPITVTGDGGSQVRLTATETLSAKSQDVLAQGERDVHLDATQDGNQLNFFVDGPFRCGGDDATVRCEHWGSDWRNPGYQAKFAFELHVPAGASVDLRTVNGDIAVTGVSSGFQVRDVNGGIDLENIAGAGEARTINGAVKAAFRSNPTADCSFASLNGDIRVYFQPGLGAVLHYKSFNGSVYSDFAVSPVAEAASTSEAGGMRVFHTGRNRFADGRVGAGGPTITLNGFNGNVYVHEAR
jgi:hypothetical protein